MREDDVVITTKRNLMEGTDHYSKSLKYFTPHIYRQLNQGYRQDYSLNAIKGIMMGVLLSIPLWMLILFLVFK